MAPRPTVIGTQGYRRGLASLSVVKELLFRVHRNAPVGRTYGRALELDRFAVTPNKLARGLSGGTYPAALRPRLPALLTSAFAEFLLGALVGLRSGERRVGEECR